jgi:hypothetical protein
MEFDFAIAADLHTTDGLGCGTRGLRIDDLPYFSTVIGDKIVKDMSEVR